MPSSMKSWPRAALLSAGLLTSPLAGAALIDVDLLAAGDRLLLRDTATGLDWLDQTETVGLTLNDVGNDVGGWRTRGFRHATLNELLDLGRNAGIPDVASISVANHAPVQGLLDRIGRPEPFFTTSGGDRTDGVLGFFQPPASHPAGGTTTGFVFNRLLITSQNLLAGPPEGIFDLNGFQAPDVNPFPVSHFLVRASSVPLPPTLYLLGLALLAFPLARRTCGQAA